MADANIDVDMIIQNVGHDGTTDFSFTVNRGDYDKALGILESVKTQPAPAKSPATARSARSIGCRRRHALPPGRRLQDVQGPG